MLFVDIGFVFTLLCTRHETSFKFTDKIINKEKSQKIEINICGKLGF